MSDYLTRLQPGHIVIFSKERWRVDSVNDCRAVIIPLEKRKTEVKQIIDGKETVVASFSRCGASVNISPNSELEIVGYERPSEKIITPVQQPVSGHNNGERVSERGKRRPKKSSK